MKSILAIGNALVDVLVELPDDALLDEWNLPKGSMQLVDRDTINSFRIGIRNMRSKMASGGSSANTACGLGKLGVTTGYIGKVGNDSTGEFFVADLQQNGVTPHIRKEETHTGVATAFISKDGERTFATCLGAAVFLSGADLFPITFGGYDLVYIEGYLINNAPLVKAIIQAAKKMGLTIAIDVASFNVVEAHRGVFEEILPHCHIVFANEMEAKALTDLEPEQAARKLAGICPTVVVKTGAEGSLIASGNALHRVQAIRANALDTTGAGDIYAAGFLYEWARGSALDVCGRTGSLLASQIVEVTGAKMDDDRWKSVLAKIS